MKRILYYLGIVIGGILSGYLFASSIFLFQSLGISSFFLLPIAILLSFLVYRCFEGLAQLNRTSLRKNITHTNPSKNKDSSEYTMNQSNQVSKNTIIDYSIELVENCLSYKATQEFPILAEELQYTINYLETFKQKNYPINDYIYKVLITLLNEYKEIVTTPIRNTPQGNNMILKIEESIKLINETLGNIFKVILNKKEMEITAIVEGFKSKLIMDGYIHSSNDFISSED